MLAVESQPLSVVNFDLPDEPDEPEISHIVRVGDIELRVLKEPNTWLVMKGQTEGALAVIRPYIHADDFAKLDRTLSSRKSLSDDLMTKIATAILEKPTGRPTPSSNGS